jgi:hypothetical protein
MEENTEASNVYMMVRGQVLMSGMGDVIDLNFQSVKTVMDLYQIKNQQSVFEKIYKVFHHFQAEKQNES